MDTQDNTGHASNLKYGFRCQNTMHVVERQFTKHEKFQTFFYDYAIASE